MCRACVRALKAYVVSMTSTHICQGQQNNQEHTCITKCQTSEKKYKENLKSPSPIYGHQTATDHSPL